MLKVMGLKYVQRKVSAKVFHSNIWILQKLDAAEISNRWRDTFNEYTYKNTIINTHTTPTEANAIVIYNMFRMV